jgi:hypothetical protein
MQTTDLSHAIVATDAFVQVLLAEEQAGWAKRFAVIADALKNGDVQLAVHSFKNCSYTGPGSLSDIFAKNESSFYLAWGDCSKSLHALAKA